MSDHDTPGKAPAPRRQAVGKRAARPRRLLRLVSAYLADAGLTAPTEAQKGLARAAAGSTLQLEDLDVALGRGEEIDPLAYARLSGVVRRNLRSLGLVEDRSLSSGNGALAGGGASSHKKNVELLSMPDWIWEGTRARECVKAGPEMVARIRASCVVALPTAKGYEALILQERLASLDQAEADAKKRLLCADNIDGKKSFTAHRDSPRGDE